MILAKHRQPSRMDRKREPVKIISEQIERNQSCQKTSNPVKYDKDFSAYIRDVSDRLHGVSAGIRAETIKKLAGRWRQFGKEGDALDKEDANTKDKFTTLVDALHNDTGIAIRVAREQQRKEPDITAPVAEDGGRSDGGANRSMGKPCAGDPDGKTPQGNGPDRTAAQARSWG
jgi:hypothetical protein